MVTDTAQLRAADVLVAVANRQVTAALAMGDELYWAAERHATATAAHEDAISKQGFSDDARRSRRAEMVRTGNALVALSRRYEALVDAAGDDLWERVESTVWRDREAEYAHARQVAEKEKDQR